MKNNSLTKLIETLLHNYENIDKININGISGNNIYDIISNNIHLDKEELNNLLPQQGATELNSQAFWRSSVINLINIFNTEFKAREDAAARQSIVENAIDTAARIDLIPNNRRINIEDINSNFRLISQSFDYIFEELFSWRRVYSSSTETNKYLIMFESIFKELLPLWENILYLWLSFFLKEREQMEKAIIKYVYLNEADFYNFRKFDIREKTITIDDVINKIEVYIDEYPNNHLCIIPIIRRNNYYENYYGEEIYPGIFYHAPNFNNQLFKTQRSFLYYPFRSSNNTAVPAGINYFNPFTENEFVRTSCNTDGDENNLNLGHYVYGYRVFENDLYYAAPFDSINTIKEIFPKSYYTLIRGVPFGNIYASNGMLLIENFGIAYHDVIAENVTGNEVIVGSYTTSQINKGLGFVTNWNKIPERYLIEDTIFLHPQHSSAAAQCELTKKRNFRSLSNFKFKYYQGECIGAQIESIEEDYSYLIEYVPLESAAQNSTNDALITTSDLDDLSTFIGSSTSPSSRYNVDNDLLEKHYDWDDKRNNIIDEKFVLRIGQHLIPETFDSTKKNILPVDKEQEYNRNYFGYESGTTTIEEKTAAMDYYNSGTIEVGAYLNIPFIKNRNKRVIYYPNFVSHTFGSNELIPLNSVEYFNENSSKPEYFSYNKLYRDYPIKKQEYFQIYTSNGKAKFEDNNWCIKMVEVITQNTPVEKSYFNNEILPPSNVATMEELYQYYINNKSSYNDNILLFFSQLNPIKFQGANTIDVGSFDFQQYVNTKYREIVDYFFSDQSENNKQEILRQIGTYLLTQYDSDKRYPIYYAHDKKSNLYTHCEYEEKTSQVDPSITYYEAKNIPVYFRLGLYGSASSSTIANYANNPPVYWEKTKASNTLIEDEGLDYIYRCSVPSILGFYDTEQKIFFERRKRNSHEYYDTIIEPQLYGFYMRAGYNHFEHVCQSGTLYYWSLIGSYIDDHLDPNIVGTRYDPGQNVGSVIEITYYQYLGLDNNNQPITHFYPFDYFSSQKINVPVIQPYNNNFNMLSYDSSGNRIPSNASQNNIWNYDESFITEALINSQTIKNYTPVYSGFSCVARMADKTSLQTENNEEKSIIDFQIFGANIPVLFKNNNLIVNYPSTWGAPLTIAYDVDASGSSTIQYRITLSAINPTGLLLLKGCSRPTGNDERTVIVSSAFASIPTALKSFYDIIQIPIYNNYNFIKNRQYPHIYLMSNKTKIPRSQLLTSTLRTNLSNIFKIYNTSSVFSSIKKYYSNINNSTSVFPFPTNKRTISTTAPSGSSITPDNSNITKLEDFYNFLYAPKSASALVLSFRSFFKENTNGTYEINCWARGFTSERDHEDSHDAAYGPYFDAFDNMHTAFYEFFGEAQYHVKAAYEKDPQRFDITSSQWHSITQNKITFTYPTAYFSTTYDSDSGHWNYVKRKFWYEDALLNVEAGTHYVSELSGVVIGDYYENGVTESNNPKPNELTKNPYYLIEGNVYSPGATVNRTIYSNTSNVNINSSLTFEDTVQASSMNLQVIVHYFGPNGTYARKVLTRQVEGNVNNENYFIVDGVKELTYKEWTNKWNVEYYDQAQFNTFESSLSSKILFKQSPSLSYTESGQVKTLNFETNPNTGKTDPESPVFV